MGWRKPPILKELGRIIDEPPAVGISCRRFIFDTEATYAPTLGGADLALSRPASIRPSGRRAS